MNCVFLEVLTAEAILDIDVHELFSYGHNTYST